MHAEHRQQQRRSHAGAILAGGAVEQCRQPIGLGEPGQEQTECRRRDFGHGVVDTYEEVIGNLRQPVLPDEVVELLRSRCRAADGHQLMANPAAQQRWRKLALLIQPQVVDHTKAELLERRQIASSQAMEAAGSEDDAPTNRPPVDRRVAAEVANVPHAFERDHPFAGHCAVAASMQNFVTRPISSRVGRLPDHR